MKDDPDKTLKTTVPKRNEPWTEWDKGTWKFARRTILFTALAYTTAIVANRFILPQSEYGPGPAEYLFRVFYVPAMVLLGIIWWIVWFREAPDDPKKGRARRNTRAITEGLFHVSIVSLLLAHAIPIGLYISNFEVDKSWIVFLYIWRMVSWVALVALGLLLWAIGNEP